MFESTAEKTEKKVNVKDMTVIALVTAVICIIAPFSIPIAISPIPITLALFADVYKRQITNTPAVPAGVFATGGIVHGWGIRTTTDR